MASDFDDLSRPAQRRGDSPPDERESLPAAPPDEPQANDEFGTRIDELVSSALEDQAREQREITDTVSSARDALEQTQQELHSLRGRIDPLERAIVDLAELISGIPAPIRRSIEESATAIGMELGRSFGMFSESSRAPLEELREKVQAVSDQVGAIGAALAEELGAAITETSTLAVGDMRESIQSSRELLEERVGSIGDQVSEFERSIEEQGEQTRSALEELSKSNEAATRESAKSSGTSAKKLADAVHAQGVEVGGVVGRAVASLSEKLDKLADRTRRAELRITESNARLEAMQESLVSYLASRDDRLERVRDTILENLIEEFASSLKNRDRVRLAVSLREAEQRRRDHRDAERYRKLRGASPGPREDDVAETRRALEGTPRAAAGGTPAVSARMIASGAAGPRDGGRRPGTQAPTDPEARPAGSARSGGAGSPSGLRPRQGEAGKASQGESNGQTQEGSRLGATAKRLGSAERASAPQGTSKSTPSTSKAKGSTRKSTSSAKPKKSPQKASAPKPKAPSRAATTGKPKSAAGKPKTTAGKSAATRTASGKKSAVKREGPEPGA
ncbi:MAG TPA: hypothetical protein VND22_03135 [Actinomycetota bacterium]|nr:hypothetical protein [Actinomycetota bacterium]